MAKGPVLDLKMSLISAESSVTLPADNIPARIKQLAQVDPEKIAFVFRYPEKPRETLTRQELFEKVELLAKYFVKIGIKPGDKVAVNLMSGATWILVQFGLYMAGGVTVNSLSSKPEEFEKLVEKLGCVATVVEMTNTPAQNAATKTVVRFTDRSANGCEFDIEEVLNKHLINEVNLPKLSSNQEVALLVTSGSSGEPKLVSHSHLSLLFFAYANSQTIERPEEGTMLNDRPMQWIAGYPGYFLGSGGTMVYVCGTIDSVKCFLDAMVEESITSVLFMEYRLLQVQKDHALLRMLPHLPVIFAGGHRISVQTARSFLNLCDQLIIGYGSTEFPLATHVSFTNLTRFQDGVGGYPLKISGIKIINQEGQVVPVGEEGEICLRGPNCAKEYVHLNRKREQIPDEEGWFHTGDIGYLCPDGVLVIARRKKDIIKRAIASLSPGFIECKLRENIDVFDVAVVGIPDDILHQEVCACIIPKLNSQLTVAKIREQAEEIFQPSLAPDGLGYMPGFFLLMEDFPRTQSGKINRSLLTTIAYEKITAKGGKQS